MIFVGSVITLAVCIVAISMGGIPERQAGVLVLVTTAVALVGDRIGVGPALPVIAADLIAAAGLLLILVFAQRIWLVVMIAATVLVLAAHALLYDGDVGPPSQAYRLAVDGLNLVALGALFAGSVQAFLRRRGLIAGEAAAHGDVA